MTIRSILPELKSQLYSRCSYLEIVEINGASFKKLSLGICLNSASEQDKTRAASIKCKLECVYFCTDHMTGPAEGEGQGGLQPPPHFFGNIKELLRKRCFQPPHFEPLASPPLPPPPTFKVAPRALYDEGSARK